MAMIYDIRTTETATNTLCNLTGVPLQVWERYVGHEREYQYAENMVEHIVDTYGKCPNDYRDFDFIYFHVTTSANGCSSFRKHGLLDLQQSYNCHDSELRLFLEEHGIYIDLDKCTLTYRGCNFDISYGRCPTREDSREYYCWSIGRKFYYDYTTCGFLSVWERNPYGGQVHRRPEILFDIDNLLKLDLSGEWESTHRPYETTAKVSGSKIVYDGDDDYSDKEKVIDFLTRAYLTAFASPSECVLLIHNHVQIPSSDILEIKPLSHWKAWIIE